MRRTIFGVTYDTEVDERISNDDCEAEAHVLYRTAAGRFCLEIIKIQCFIDGEWVDSSFANERRDDIPRRHFESIRPLTLPQALDWFIEHLVAECFEEAFRRSADLLPQ
jgi:hypothetical protein